LENEKRIEDTIKEMLVERLFLKMKPEQISDEGLLGEELGVDSVSVFEIVVGLEEVYGISVADEEFRMETFQSVRKIAEFVRGKIGKK
jgi:acyl carrier protein